MCLTSLHAPVSNFHFLYLSRLSIMSFSPLVISKNPAESGDDVLADSSASVLQVKGGTSVKAVKDFYFHFVTSPRTSLSSSSYCFIVFLSLLHLSYMFFFPSYYSFCVTYLRVLFSSLFHLMFLSSIYYFITVL